MIDVETSLIKFALYVFLLPPFVNAYVTSFSHRQQLNSAKLSLNHCMALNLANLSPQEVLQGSDLAYQIKKGPHPLSPPAFLMELPLNYSVNPIPSIPELTITRIAHDPDIFHLENVSSMEEHLSLMEHASNQGMEYSGTKSGDMVKQRVNSYTAWIYPNEGDADNRAVRVANFMTDVLSHLFVREELKGSPASVSHGKKEDYSELDCIAEAMQVVKYEPGGRYDVHHDGYNRFATVLTYLNGIAGTWFPYAVLEKKNYGVAVDYNESEIPDMAADNVAADKIPGQDGLLVVGAENDTRYETNDNILRINRGDAIVFYNYDWIEKMADDPNVPPTGPMLNWRSIHSGMETEKEKWIGTHWFHVQVQ